MTQHSAPEVGARHLPRNREEAATDLRMGDSPMLGQVGQVGDDRPAVGGVVEAVHVVARQRLGSPGRPRQGCAKVGHHRGDPWQTALRRWS